MLKLLKNLLKEESGQDLIEYALIAGLLSVASVAAIGTVATAIGAEWTKVSGALS